MTPGRRAAARRGSARPGALAALFVPIGSWIACTDAEPGLSAAPGRLELVREWLRPDLSPETDWFTYPSGMVFDPATGHLLVQDRDTKAIIEITEDGRLVRAIGREGQGPGEIGHATRLAVDADRVYALDNQNLKLLVFRRDGSLETEFRVSTLYGDFEVLPGDRVLAAPGLENAIDILNLDGEIIGGIGERSEIVVGCYGCPMERLSDGRIAIMNGDRPEMWVFHEDGREPTWSDLSQIPLIRRWQEDLAGRLREMQRMAAERGWGGAGRTWMSNELETSGPGSLLVRVGPPSIMETGLEIWRLDMDTGSVDRYDFGEPKIGYAIAVEWPRLFTSNIEDGSILEYRIPDSD